MILLGLDFSFTKVLEVFKDRLDEALSNLG